MANRLSQGNTVDYQAPADVTAGDLIKFGTFVGVAENDIPAGRLGALAVTGVFRFDANVGAATPEQGEEFDVDLTTMELVAPGAGDGDINVYIFKDYTGTPAVVDAWINQIGG